MIKQVYRAVLVAAVVFFALVPGSKAAMVYSGSVSSGDGLTVASGWSDVTLSWTVDDETHPGYWTYAYTFSCTNKSISHVIFEVSESFTRDNLIDVYASNVINGTSYSITYDPDAPKWYESSGTSGDNPGMPDVDLEEGGEGDLFGIKWNSSGSGATQFTITIVSDRAPMWGDFYAKNGGKTYAYNTGFGTETSAPIGSGNAGGWVLVPNTVVPIPASLYLLSSGLLCFIGWHRRRG